MGTLIGLLAVTGLRQGEACRLSRDDIDLGAGTAVIRDSNFGKSRMVFPDPTAVTALRAYGKARDTAFPETETDAVFETSKNEVSFRKTRPNNNYLDFLLQFCTLRAMQNL